jgi:hypothetical protein
VSKKVCSEPAASSTGQGFDMRVILWRARIAPCSSLRVDAVRSISIRSAHRLRNLRVSWLHLIVLIHLTPDRDVALSDQNRLTHREVRIRLEELSGGEIGRAGRRLICSRCFEAGLVMVKAYDRYGCGYPRRLTSRHVIDDEASSKGDNSA